MTKNTFELFMNSVNYTDYISYPVMINEKNLGESYNLYKVNFGKNTRNTPYEPHKRVELKWYVDDVLHKTFYGILATDAIEELGVTGYYKHNLEILEYTYLFELMNLPDMTITRIQGTYEPTLGEAAQRVIDLGLEEFGDPNLSITIDSATLSILNQFESPEWTFTRFTVIDALRAIFGYANIVPFMTSFTTLGHVHPLNVQEDASDTGAYFNLSQAYNPESYRTRLISEVDNFIVESDSGTIIEPSANGWLTPRSPDGFEISANNAYVPTSRPIYNIDDFGTQAKEMTITVTNTETSTTLSTTILIQSTNPIWFKPYSLAPYVFEKGVWDTLPNTASIGAKGGSFYYEQGSEGIKNLSYRAENRWSWTPVGNAYTVVSLYINNLNPGVSNYQDFVKEEYWTDFITFMQNAYEAEHGSLPPLREEVYRCAVETDVIDFKSRITYTPYVQTSLYTYKERKESSTELPTTQFYNQQANVLSSSVLGDLLDRVSKGNSGDEKQIGYLHRNASDMFTVGKKVGDYVITSASNELSYYGSQTSYNLDKYFKKLNEYVAVLEKWRQFSIPSENIVRRQITTNLFAKFSTSAAGLPSQLSSLKAPWYIEPNTNEPQILATNVGGASYYNPVSSFAFNNTLVWEATFAGNASAGVKSVSFDVDKHIDEPVRYTDINGRINGGATFNLLNKFAANDMNVAQSQALPIMPGFLTADIFFTNAKTIDKDAREQLSYSLQIHHVDTTGKVYLNPLFTAMNGLTGGPGLNDFDGRRILFLSEKPYGQKEITSSTIVGSRINETPFSMLGNTAQIAPMQNPGGTNGVAWAYAQYDTATMKYKILFWVDEAVNSGQFTNPLYINFDNEY